MRSEQNSRLGAATVSVRGARTFRVRSAALKEAVVAALAHARSQVCGEVTVVLTDDAVIRKLNRRYRGEDRATDVLSFALSEGEAAGGKTVGDPFGDVVISVPTARRQAREYGAALREELVRLAIHGTLHLCGYDHETPGQARRMFRVSRRVEKQVLSGG